MRVLFIGNRFNVLFELLNTFKEEVSIVNIFVLKNSLLETELKKIDCKYSVFSLNDKDQVIEKIKNLNFDILISNGCPFILPVSKIKRNNQKFLNIHPTYLPFLKGKTPVNGVFYNNMSFFGASLHFMDDGIDTGKIIYQEKVDLTDDINLSMLYYMSFRLESDVFKHGFNYYILNKNSIPEYPKTTGSFFNRNKAMQIVDLNESNKTIISKIKSFGISSQGATLEIGGKTIRIYEATEILNKRFLFWFNSSKTKKIILEIDQSIYIKSREGIIRLDKYKWEN